jgi:sulfotransferase family protein
MSNFDERLCWIFGSSRSGSTWLLRMLSELDRVVPIDDPHLGHHLGVWRPIPLAWATEEELPELRTLPDFKRNRRDYFFSDRYRDAWLPALRELIRTRFESQVAEEGIDDPIVLVKEPASHVADWLLEIFPRSRMIFLLRDGRDVVDSWLDAYREGSWATEEGAYPLSERGREALIRWQASVWLRRTEVVQHAYAAHDPGRRALIRYEDLRRDPTVELPKICGVLRANPSQEQIDEIVAIASYERVPFAQKGDGQEIRRAKPGCWRESMTPAEQRAMHEILAPKLEELGYLAPVDRRTTLAS